MQLACNVKIKTTITVSVTKLPKTVNVRRIPRTVTAVLTKD